MPLAFIGGGITLKFRGSKMDAKEFLSIFPEFEKTPEARINLFLTQAENEITPKRFGASTDFAKALFVAHYLTCFDNGQRQTEEGGTTEATIAKGTGGQIASKSVGSVSVSFDTAGSSFADAGTWNSTEYGKQFYALLRRFRRLPFVSEGRAKWP